MPEQRGWPDPDNPGIPLGRDREWPHLLEDERGKRRWLMWIPSAAMWVSGSRRHHPPEAARLFAYLGPADEPAEARPMRRRSDVRYGK